MIAVHIRSTKIWALLLGAVSSLAASTGFAESPEWQAFYASNADTPARETRTTARLAVGEDYALGLSRYDLDSHTEILGWQLRESLYFGRQDGLDSGLTLVWQADANQLSVSKEGLRLTRRF